MNRKAQPAHEQGEPTPAASTRLSDSPEFKDANGDPVFAADGTDLTVIRWMLAMSPEERLRWLQSHMRAVARIRREQRGP